MAEGGVPSSGVLMKALGRRLCFLDEEASAVRIFFPVRPWPKKPYPVHWIAPLMALFMSAVSLRAAVEWQQDFEGSTNGWTTGGSANVWQIGKPTSGPGMAHSGTNCAGTILNGDYPDNVSASLFSPQFVVPAAVQQPRLRFWSWHNTCSAGDYGQVWIRPDGGAWTNLTEHITGPGGAWTQRIIDLSAYGGQNVQIAFQFVSDQFSCPRPGWYIDDVSADAVSPPPSITSVSNNPVTGSNSPQPFYINGANFVAGCNVTLRDLTAGQTFPNRTITSFSSTQIRIDP